MKLPTVKGGWGVILADPPWSFSDKGSRIAPDQKLGKKVRHYRTMSTNDIFSMPVEAIAAPDAFLALWFPDTHLIEALAVQAAWGFRYKHMIPWVKARLDPKRGLVHQIGMGHYMRKSHELAMLCVRGRPEVRDHGVASSIVAPRSRHSAKPPDLHQKLMRLAVGPYLELFARQAAEGWAVWGDEAPPG